MCTLSVVSGSILEPEGDFKLMFGQVLVHLSADREQV